MREVFVLRSQEVHARRQFSICCLDAGNHGLGWSANRVGNCEGRIEQLRRHGKIQKVPEQCLTSSGRRRRRRMERIFRGLGQDSGHFLNGGEELFLLDVLQHPIENQVIGVEVKVRGYEVLLAGGLVLIRIGHVMDLEVLLGRQGLDVEPVLGKPLPVGLRKSQHRYANPLGDLFKPDGGLVEGCGEQGMQIASRDKTVSRPVREVEPCFDPTPPLQLELANGFHHLSLQYLQHRRTCGVGNYTHQGGFRHRHIPVAFGAIEVWLKPQLAGVDITPGFLAVDGGADGNDLRLGRVVIPRYCFTVVHIRGHGRQIALLKLPVRKALLGDLRLGCLAKEGHLIRNNVSALPARAFSGSPWGQTSQEVHHFLRHGLRIHLRGARQLCG